MRRMESDMPAGEWLSASGQSHEAIEGFWEPILTGALNDTLDLASARYASLVIRQAMLMNRSGFRLGIPAVPLGVLHDELPRDLLGSQGCRLHLGEQVTEIICDGTRSIGVRLSTGEVVSADYVINATDPASCLIPPHLARTSAGNAPQLRPKTVPIITLHLWYRERMEVPTALCTQGGRFHWCFNRSAFSPQPVEAGTALALVASAARDLVSLSHDEIRAIGVGELGRALGSTPSDLCRWLVTKQSHATFSPSVGCDSVRPSQETRVTNLFLAGDWTDTGWPGTMESAVRSGYICARKILEQSGMHPKLPVPDIPPRGLATLLFRHGG